MRLRTFLARLLQLTFALNATYVTAALPQTFINPSAPEAQSACPGHQATMLFNVSNDTVYFDDISTGTNGSTSYSWDFGDGNSSTQQNPIHTYGSSGNYLACLSITTISPDGLDTCISTDCQAVEINLCQNHSAAYSYLPNNTSVSFTDQSQGTNGSSTYSWDFGDGSTSTQQSPTHVYSTDGTYNVCLTVETVLPSQDTCSSTYCDNIVVQDICSGHQASFFHAANLDTVYFDLSTSAGINGSTTYSWDFGDGNSSTQQNAIHVYDSAGAYIVCLTLTTTSPDGQGNCVSTFCDTVEIDFCQNHTAAFSYTANGVNVNFANLSQGTTANTTYSWNFGDGNGSIQQAPTHAYSSSGTYNVCLTIQTVLNGQDTCVNTYCDNVVIDLCDNHAAAFAAAVNGLDVSFTDQSQGINGNTNYIWDFGDGSSSILQSPIHAYSSGGTYNVCLTINTVYAPQDSCSNTYCATVTVVDNCAGHQADFEFQVDQNKVIFDNVSAGLNGTTSYSWDFGDGNSSIQKNPIHLYNNSGTYITCLTITSLFDGGQDTCVSSFCDTVEIDFCDGHFASFSNSINGLSVAFSNQSQGINGATSYSWDFGDGNSSSLSSPSHTYGAPGIYTVCLTIETGFSPQDSCSSVFCANLLVVDSCDEHHAMYSSVVNEDTVNFSNASAGTNGTTSYSWDFGDGNSSMLQNPQHIYSSPGTYVSCLTISSIFNNGQDTCESTLCDTIVISTLLNDTRRNAITSFIEFYPNPASGVVTVEAYAPEFDNAVVELVTIDGKIVRRALFGQSSSHNRRLTLDVSGLSQGIYALRVIAKNKVVAERLKVE